MDGDSDQLTKTIDICAYIITCLLIVFNLLMALDRISLSMRECCLAG